jgi:hypothetical protein
VFGRTFDLDDGSPDAGADFGEEALLLPVEEALEHVLLHLFVTAVEDRDAELQRLMVHSVFVLGGRDQVQDLENVWRRVGESVLRRH